jgi:hypothetical protein
VFGTDGLVDEDVGCLGLALGVLEPRVEGLGVVPDLEATVFVVLDLLALGSISGVELELARDRSEASWIACDRDFGLFGWLESWIKSIWLSIAEESLLTIARSTPLSELDRAIPSCPVRFVLSIFVSSS